MVWRRQRQLDDFVDHRLIERGDPRRPALVPEQAIDALSHEALLPAPHAGFRLCGGGHDRTGTEALIAQENDPRPPNMFLGRTARRNDRFKSRPVRGGDRNAYTSTHPALSHPATSMGIPNRTLLFRSIH